jgi:pimeloyl-ACP methyl ester carboxylesterase
MALQILFLHALPFGRGMWRAQLDAFSGLAVAPNLYPCGANLTNWAHHALEEVTSDRLIVVGNSVGGSCALEIAALAPHRVEALVLVGAKAERRIDSALKDECVELLRTHGFDAAWSKYWAPFLGPSLSLKQVAEAKELASRTSVEHIINGVKAFHTRPSRFQMLGQLDCPVICVSGEHDIAPGPEVTKMQAKTAPNGHYIEVPDCGHYVPLEKPDILNAILDELAN